MTQSSCTGIVASPVSQSCLLPIKSSNNGFLVLHYAKIDNRMRHDIVLPKNKNETEQRQVL